jgi:hypothetical protein
MQQTHFKWTRDVMRRGNGSVSASGKRTASQKYCASRHLLHSAISALYGSKYSRVVIAMNYTAGGSSASLNRFSTLSKQTHTLY